MDVATREMHGEGPNSVTNPTLLRSAGYYHVRQARVEPEDMRDRFIRAEEFAAPQRSEGRDDQIMLPSGRDGLPLSFYAEAPSDLTRKS